jgi:anti-sigma-K factor RskA
MDYGKTELADALAADYVIGTLRGGARRRFEALLPAHSELRAATAAWNARLLPLTGALPPVQPSSQVWRGISDRLDRRKSVQASSAWQRLSFWRGLSAFASVAAIGLAVLLGNPRTQPPPVIVVLAATGAATSAASGANPGSIVASISGDGATLVTRPILPVAVRPDRSLELWAVPKDGVPRSLGVLAAGTGTVALRPRVLAGADTLAVTVEPVGGSPTGAPTGPIVYAGKFSL